MYNWDMSLALTQMMVICGVCLGQGHYILYVWDRNCEMRVFFIKGDIYFMNVSSNDCDLVLFVELPDIHSFFMTNLLNFSNIFFLTVSRCAQDRFKNYNPIQILVLFHNI
jgi:hypothetical protein